MTFSCSLALNVGAVLTNKHLSTLKKKPLNDRKSLGVDEQQSVTSYVPPPGGSKTAESLLTSHHQGAVEALRPGTDL